MKKILLTSLVAIGVVGAANASVFDPTYRVKEGQFAGTAGMLFQTGETKKHDAMTDFTSGAFHVGDVSLAYGLAQKAYVFLNMNGPATQGVAFNNGAFANPEFGANAQIIGDKAFSLDVIASWGMALTKDRSVPRERIGNNNWNGGFKAYGAIDKFQWAATALGQYTFMEKGDCFIARER